MQSRLRLPQPDTMSPEQRAIHDEVLRTRGNASGPFLAWLHSPGLADPAQRLGAFCRYGTGLSLLESEMLILLVASAYDCAGEQAIHEPIAARAGLPDATIEAIRRGQVPAMPTARMDLLAQVAETLTRTRRLPGALHDRAVEALGERTLVEVVGLVGYYALVAYTLNAFDMKPAA